MKKYIDINTIKIKKNMVIFLKGFCKDKKYDPKNMFLYIKDNTSLYVGFSNDEYMHIKIDDDSWVPTYDC